MQVGVLRVTLRIPGNHSLKGKRHVVRSIVDRVRGRFNVAIAEVDDQDLWQTATLAICCVGSDAATINQVLSRVAHFIGQNPGDSEVLDYEMEIVPVF
ncbi:MAG: DUF503 domain-containing protein [Chloroflexota bacterium]